jgi:hypothetical protein
MGVGMACVPDVPVKNEMMAPVANVAAGRKAAVIHPSKPTR